MRGEVGVRCAVLDAKKRVKPATYRFRREARCKDQGWRECIVESGDRDRCRVRRVRWRWLTCAYAWEGEGER